MALRPAAKLMHESAGQSDLLRGKLENTGFSEHMADYRVEIYRMDDLARHPSITKRVTKSWCGCLSVTMFLLFYRFTPWRMLFVYFCPFVYLSPLVGVSSYLVIT